MPPQPRVVSLIPSATEIVAALGCEGWLVGRSHECDFPQAVRNLPVCTAARIDTNASSAEIDRQVKSLLRNAVSIYEIDATLLKRLQPDIILTQSQCEVCAVSLADVEQALCSVVSSRPRLVSLAPHGLADVWNDIQMVADALGISGRGAELTSNLQARLDAITEGARAAQTRPAVACIEWVEPLMSAGNWVPELVEIAGGKNLFGEAGKHSPWMTWDDLRQRDPEVLVLMPCGWNLARTRCELGPLTSRADWPLLRAVQTGRVYLTDGNQFFNRPGPRLVESAEILAEILHPDRFHFGHRGIGWEAL